MGRLFWKFFFAFWVALLIGGVGVGSIVWLRHQAMDRMPTLVDTHGLATPFVSAAYATVQHGGTAALRQLTAELDREPMPRVYAIDESNREILGRDVAPALLEQARLIVQEGSHPHEVREVAADDGHRYVLFVSFSQQGTANTSMHPPNQVPLPHGEGPPPPIIPIMLGIFASLIFSAWLAWYLAKPIRTLHNAFDSLAQGQMNTRAAYLMGKRRDELADLGQHFDHMASQISTLMKAQRCLLHDVSHELRSPLARLQVAIGLVRQQPEKTESALARIEQESQRLSDLVEELLTLSKLEAGVLGAMEDIDIGELLVEIVEDSRFEAKAKGILIRLDDPEKIVVRGRAELLQRSMENVIRNAVQHTPVGGAIDIEINILITEGGHSLLRLSILDEGAGVDEVQLPKIFDPFFRGGSRSGTEGFGLGLAIARRAIEAHGGHISASNRHGRGLCVEMDLPLRSL